MSESVLRPAPIVRALQGAFAREVTRAELLQLAAARITATGPPYTGAHLYLREGPEMVLHASTGRPLDASSPGMLTVSIRRHDEILGQVVVASDAEGALDATEAAAVREIADALAVLL